MAPLRALYQLSCLPSIQSCPQSLLAPITGGLTLKADATPHRGHLRSLSPAPLSCRAAGEVSQLSQLELCEQAHRTLSFPLKMLFKEESWGLGRRLGQLSAHCERVKLWVQISTVKGSIALVCNLSSHRLYALFFNHLSPGKTGMRDCWSSGLSGQAREAPVLEEALLHKWKVEDN